MLYTRRLGWRLFHKGHGWSVGQTANSLFEVKQQVFPLQNMNRAPISSITAPKNAWTTFSSLGCAFFFSFSPLKILFTHRFLPSNNFQACAASFSVGLDREIMVHREIGRGKEEKRMRGGPYQKKERRNNFIFPEKCAARTWKVGRQFFKWAIKIFNGEKTCWLT